MKSCKEIAKRMTPGAEKMSFFEKMELGLHLVMCKMCQRYMRELRLVKVNIKKLYLKRWRQVDSKKVKELETKVLSQVKRS